MKNVWRIALYVLIGLLILAIAVPVGYRLLGGLWRWGFGSEKTVNQESVCEEVEMTSSLPVVEASDYLCNAVAIGTPVSTEGSCSFCTVNYSRPGPVFIVEATPMEYSSGAWVFQYTVGDLQAFKTCIQGQPFFADPQYEPVWK